jgi:pyroglutamyl-peptidase
VAKRRRPAFADVDRVLHIFETSYTCVDRDLPKLMAEHKPDIVLMFGLAGRTSFVRVEMLARNARSILFPDVTGFLPPGRTIVSGKLPTRGNAPFTRLIAASRAARVPTRLSRDAGRYLCNYVYWRALEASRSGTLTQFIHIPPVPRGARRARRPGRKRVTAGALARSGEAILLALLAAQRRLG